MFGQLEVAVAEVEAAMAALGAHSLVGRERAPDAFRVYRG